MFRPILHPTSSALTGLEPVIDVIERLSKSASASDAVDRLCTAAATGEIEVLVADVFARLAFGVVRDAWSSPEKYRIDRVACFELGRLVLDPTQLPPTSIELRLRDQPLFVRSSTLPPWARRQKPSKAALREATSEYISECVRAQRIPALKEATEVLARSVGVSARQARAMYRRLVNPSWLKRGPKPQQSRRGGQP